jgi:hypothetical protein
MKQLLLAGVASLFLVTNATAIVLVPGSGPVAPSLLSVGAGATLEASIVDAPFVSLLGASDFSGTYSAWVFKDPTNTFAPGDLTFVYETSNNSGSSEDINRITVSNFTGFMTNVGFGNTAGTLAPNTVDRTSSGPIGFSFFDGIVPGETSNLMIVETNARLLTSGHISMINNGVSLNDAFQPAIPEPSTWAMVLMGFMAVAFSTLMRRRLREL